MTFEYKKIALDDDTIALFYQKGGSLFNMFKGTERKPLDMAYFDAQLDKFKDAQQYYKIDESMDDEISDMVQTLENLRHRIHAQHTLDDLANTLLYVHKFFNRDLENREALEEVIAPFGVKIQNHTKYEYLGYGTGALLMTTVVVTASCGLLYMLALLSMALAIPFYARRQSQDPKQILGDKLFHIMKDRNFDFLPEHKHNLQLPITLNNTDYFYI